MKSLRIPFFVALLVGLLTACTKDKVDYTGYTPNLPKGGNTDGTDATGNGDVGAAEYYFKGKIEGSQLTWPVDNQRERWAEGISNTISLDGEVINAAYGGSISNAEVFMVNEPSITFYFKTFHFVGFEDRTLGFENFVKAGDWEYAPNFDLNVGIKEVYVKYVDKNKREFVSEGFQTNSFFKVLSTTLVPAQPGQPERLKIKLQLQCTLRPKDGIGSLISLYDAEAVIYISQE